MTDATPRTIRLDKWLWHARFFKSRSIAAGVVTAGKVRVDGTPVSKPARIVGPDNVLTFIQAEQTKVIRILHVGQRRGPAPEAQALYEDLSPAPVHRPAAAKGSNPRYDKGGRPTKKDRRDMGLDDR